MAWRGVVGKHALGLETEDANIILAVEYNELVCSELYLTDGGSSREVQGYTDSTLTVDVDEAGSKAGVVGADGEEVLDRVVCECRDLRVDAIPSELGGRSVMVKESGRGLTSSSCMESGWMPWDRSCWIPACFPRKKEAILFNCYSPSICSCKACALRGVKVGLQTSEAWGLFLGAGNGGTARVSGIHLNLATGN